MLKAFGVSTAGSHPFCPLQEGGGLKNLAISDQLVQYFCSFFIEPKKWPDHPSSIAPESWKQP